MAHELLTTTKQEFIKRELAGFRRILIAALVVILALSVWQSISTINVHKSYQTSLMDSVTDQVISDYTEHLRHLRTQIDKFQIQYRQEISHLHEAGASANNNDYMALLQQLKKNIEHVRLFSFVDTDGEGLLKHITGDFLPDCKEEIHDTLSAGTQENLFFHHSKSSVHYDLLQPLLITGSDAKFFVAFNIDKFKTLLSKYQLPQQQMFLLRKDHIGKVELSTEKQYTAKLTDAMVMSESEIAKFNFQKSIPNTRWNIAIRLSDQYLNELILSAVLKSTLIWFIASFALFFTYRLKKLKTLEHFKTLQHIEYTESYDQLTGLLNRQSFLDLLENETSGLDSDHGVVLFIDLDKFQSINNVHGYTKGEMCLNLCTKMLKKRLSQEAQLARMGNDQFAIFNPRVVHQTSLNYAEEIRSSIAELNLSEVDESLSLTCCIGVVNLHHGFEDSQQIMTSVMKAINLAKSKGRNRIQLYQSDDPALKQHAVEMETLKLLKRAINAERLLLFRQQIQSTSSTTKVKSYEVLARLEHEGEIISPALFIPIAEKNGFALELDRCVIKQAIQQIANNRDESHYSINLSGQTLATPNLIGFVKELLDKHQVVPEQLTFEITETFAITHLESAIQFITEVTKLGCNFALDDFGSGLSSFSYLQRLPVQKLKIDGVFIRNLCNEPRNQAFVKTMVALAKSMEMETVAEYVETENELIMLKELGLDYCQGYYIHKPSPWL